MINLIELRLRNFLSFQEEFFDFHKSGLYLISGWNEKGQDSNGSGKSAVLNAICFALFGRTATGLTKDEVKRWDSHEPMEVILVLAEGNDKYIIQRTETATTFMINGQPLEGHKRDIQTLINDTFKTNYDLFLSSTMFTTSRVDFLAAQTDAERKRLFKPIFQLDRLDKAYENAKNKYDEVCQNLDNLAFGIEYKKKSINEHINAKIILEEKAKKNDSETQLWIKSYEEKIKNLPTISGTAKEEMEEAKKNLYQLEQQWETIKGEVDEVHAKLDTKRIDRARLEAEFCNNASLLSETSTWKEQDGECRYCGAPLSRKGLVQHRKSLALLNAEIRNNILKLDTEIIELNGQILQFTTLQTAIQQANDVSFRANSRYEMERIVVANNIKRIEEAKDSIAKLKNMPNPYTDQVKTETTILEKLNIELESLKQTQEQLFKDVDCYGFLKWVFSKEGLSSFIIERAFGRLESLANRYISLLSTEGYQIEIRPQKELKSKALKEEIDIIVKTNNRRVLYWALSAGQRQRLNIAILLAVYRLCKDKGINNFDFLLLDEVLDLSLAEKGQDDVIRLMRRLLGEINNIFIISHKDEIKSDFDFSIEIMRDEHGISKIV